MCFWTKVQLVASHASVSLKLTLLGSPLDTLRAPSPIGWERAGVRGAGVVQLVDSSSNPNRGIDYE